MRLLVDTHVLIWCLGDDPRLSAAARSAVEAKENEVFVSAATVWEAGIKRALGKLKFEKAALLSALAVGAYRELPVTIAHALAASELPPHHKDPFDRMLVAQAMAESLTLVTHDAALKPYGVSTIWT